jgi:hypothetical protein
VRWKRCRRSKTEAVKKRRDSIANPGGCQSCSERKLFNGNRDGGRWNAVRDDFKRARARSDYGRSRKRALFVRSFSVSMSEIAIFRQQSTKLGICMAYDRLLSRVSTAASSFSKD